MKSFFTSITTLSLRFRAVTILIVLVVSILGIVSWTELKQELLPPIEVPQTFILAQVSGMSSEQVLAVMTERIEAALDDIPEVVNIESTTTGAFGSFIQAFNDFGIDQEKVREEIQTSLEQVWFPVRQIQPPDGQDGSDFAVALLNDLEADALIYLAERDDTFLFQLSPDTWSAFSDDTVLTILGYLATQETEVADDKSVLEALVDQELIPQINTIEAIGNVTVSGGQLLPGEGNGATSNPETIENQPTSLLLQLPPDIWSVVSKKAGDLGALDATAVRQLEEIEYQIPTTPPILPESWLQDHFSDTSDLMELGSFTRSMADVFNEFRGTGHILGSLGQTDDLTPETINRMLDIDSSLVEYFEAEHLVAMSPELFATLPDEFINGLDGFTRDELASAALAESITGEQVIADPVDLPQSWRIQPPQLITFSFADLPLAVFSVFDTGVTGDDRATESTDIAANPDVENTNETAGVNENTPISANIPEGPALPLLLSIVGEQLGVELDTADDLVDIQLPDDLAGQLGAAGSLAAADFFNFLVLLGNAGSLPGGSSGDAGAGGFDPASFASNPDVLPALNECGIGLLALASGDVDFASLLVGCMDSEVISFLAEYDDTFMISLAPAVFDYFTDDMLALSVVEPPLADVWNTLGNRPQFDMTPLRTAKDLQSIGGGRATTVLNTINRTIPERFAGYEVRLLDSIRPGLLRYFAINEPDFYTNLDTEVLQKLSDEALRILPSDFVESLDEDFAANLRAIASGEQDSAMATLEAALYETDVVPADPSAPVLNSEWQFIAGFIPGVQELNNAYDLFRFPDAIETPAEFINNLFDSPAGANFAPGLLGGLSSEAFDYIADLNPEFVDALSAEALQLFADDVKANLPEEVLERANSGGQTFKPTRTVTRTNGASSLSLTVFKTSDANTVDAFHAVEDVLNRIDAENENIEIAVALELSSFIEESISGVAREASLGAVFAVIIILLFLSGGIWSRSPRRVAGTIMIVLFAAILGILVVSNLDSTGGDVGAAVGQVDVVLRILLVLGIFVGLVALFWPGNLPDPAWRSTLVTAVSIPLSLLMALALMHWLPPFMHQLIEPAAADSPILSFVLRLFPEGMTLNLMTLSGLTVSIGRVVDDSIVVLENIFRQIQAGGDKREAILSGTRDVSVAIFSATAIAVVVFLPLGLTGGLVSEFFLPFGLAVTYALASSFIVAVTVVPVLAYLFIDQSHVPAQHRSWLERLYVPVLRWALAKGRNRATVLIVAIVSMIIGFGLFATRPFAFLPSFGEPQISVAVEMPGNTKILETSEKVSMFEEYVREAISADDLKSISTIIGGGGVSLESFIGGGGNVSENIAQMTVNLASQDMLEQETQLIRSSAEEIFGADNVTVSAASLNEQGFGGFALVLSGPQDDLEAIDADVINTLNAVDGLTNVTSTLAQLQAGGGDTTSYLRVNRETALSYSGELETEDTIGVAQQAIQAIAAMPNLPDTLKVSQGFQSELQSEGFLGVIAAMGIAMAIVVLILMVTFGSVVHWLDIMLSVIVAPVGAAVALTLTDSVLGVSALIGMLMLIGIVVTNAVVLIDRVQSNRRERGLELYDALVEAGGRRVRPIVMTAFATIIALIPLAVGLSEGAIIAAELGIVVIGGLFSSTLLTLIVVPVAYSLLAPVHKFTLRLVGR